MENDYLSDDDKNDNTEEKELTFEEMYPDEEIDEETLNLIYSNNINEINFDDFNSNSGKKKNKKQNKNKEPDIISLKQLSQQFEEKKTEKWISKRTELKRNDSKKENKNEPRYKFNPRLPPFNTIYKEYNNNKEKSITIDNINFPSL
jgi:hypothetical protein